MKTNRNLISRTKKKDVDHFSVEIISKLPPAFSCLKILDKNLLKEIKESMIRVIDDDPKEISLTGENDSYCKYSSLKRRAISWKKINSFNVNYKPFLSHFFAQKKFISKLLFSSNEILKDAIDTDQKSTTMLKTGYFLLCRIRLLIDYKGYFLSPHTDSEDTLMALLVPLDIDLTPTALFRRTEQPIKPISTLEKSKLVKCNFIPNRYLFAEDISKTVQDYKKDKHNQLIFDCNWIIRNPKLDLGDALVLPNPICNAWRANKKKQIKTNQFSKHGVFPPIKETVRPMLLVDYLIREKGLSVASNEYDIIINL